MEYNPKQAFVISVHVLSYQGFGVVTKCPGIWKRRIGKAIRKPKLTMN